jgi:hypothetical protein
MLRKACGGVGASPPGHHRIDPAFALLEHPVFARCAGQVGTGRTPRHWSPATTRPGCLGYRRLRSGTTASSRPRSPDRIQFSDRRFGAAARRRSQGSERRQTLFSKARWRCRIAPRTRCKGSRENADAAVGRLDRLDPSDSMCRRTMWVGKSIFSVSRRYGDVQPGATRGVRSLVPSNCPSAQAGERHSPSPRGSVTRWGNRRLLAPQDPSCSPL